MSAVFADTFYLLGLVNRADQAHNQCVQFSRQYSGTLITTAYVLVEFADAMAVPTHRMPAVRFIRAIGSRHNVRVVPESPILFERALDLYSARHDKSWSLTDCISFIVMGDEGIKDAATGDRHFEQAGFNILLK